MGCWGLRRGSPSSGGRECSSPACKLLPPHPAPTFPTAAALEDRGADSPNGWGSAVGSRVTASLKPAQSPGWGAPTGSRHRQPLPSPRGLRSRASQPQMLDPERTEVVPGEHCTWSRSHPQHPRTAPGGHGRLGLHLRRGIQPRLTEQLGAGTQGLSVPLRVEGTEEPLSLSIPSPLRPISGPQPEEEGGALRGAPTHAAAPSRDVKGEAASTEGVQRRPRARQARSQAQGLRAALRGQWPAPQ